MAVKTSWSSGDVLTAADLTDTFAAKGDVAGETWTGTHDFTGATVTGAGALVLVATASPSSVSSVSIDNCFTSTYDNYRVVAHVSGGGGALKMRMRASSADDTNTSYKRWQGVGSSSPTLQTADYGSASTVFILSSSASEQAGSMDVLRPQATAFTRVSHGFVFYDSGSGNSGLTWGGGTFAATTSFDGFTFFVDTGTFTGSIRVYGYQNS